MTVPKNMTAEIRYSYAYYYFGLRNRLPLAALE